MKPPPADPDRFWAIIDETVDEDEDIQMAALEKALGKMTKAQLVAFHADYRRAHQAAYRHDLRGAFYIINGGCSDDGFHYACDWLISRGRPVYEAALADPESLATHLGADEDAGFEEFGYVVYKVFENKFEDDFPQIDMPHPGDPEGEPWEEEDLPERFPKLTAWDAARNG